MRVGAGTFFKEEEILEGKPKTAGTGRGKVRVIQKEEW